MERNLLLEKKRINDLERKILVLNDKFFEDFYIKNSQIEYISKKLISIEKDIKEYKTKQNSIILGLIKSNKNLEEKFYLLNARFTLMENKNKNLIIENKNEELISIENSFEDERKISEFEFEKNYSDFTLILSDDSENENKQNEINTFLRDLYKSEKRQKTNSTLVNDKNSTLVLNDVDNKFIEKSLAIFPPYNSESEINQFESFVKDGKIKKKSCFNKIRGIKNLKDDHLIQFIYKNLKKGKQK